jgi:hypothetical protein
MVAVRAGSASDGDSQEARSAISRLADTMSNLALTWKGQGRTMKATRFIGEYVQRRQLHYYRIYYLYMYLFNYYFSINIVCSLS